MKIAIGILGTLLLFARFADAQATGSSAPRSPVQNSTTAENDRESYAVFGATSLQESALREQIRLMHPEVLPLRIFLVPHWKYLESARAFQLLVPIGYSSVMFTHLPSRTVFIDDDRYLGEEWLGHYMAHELGHLAKNSTNENDAEKAAHEFRKRLKAAQEVQPQTHPSAVQVFPQPPNGERLRIAVHLYNDVRVPDEQVRAAEEVASGVLWQAGIKLGWSDCTVTRDASGRASSPCELLGPLGVAVYFVGPLELHFKWVDRHALGFSIIPENARPATMAYISYARVQRLTASTNTCEAELLGLAVAHEIAHLLLGSHDHANQGIMRATWRLRDLEATDWNEFHFTREQANRLRCAVRVRQEGAKLAINGRNTTD